MTWTPEIVLWRLIDAYRVIEATTPYGAPKAYGNAMPSPVDMSGAEAYRFELDDIVNNAGRSVRQMKDDRRIEIERKRRKAASAESISMALEAQRWPIDVITDLEKRECLMSYAVCRSRDWDWSRFIQNRNRRCGTKKQWIRRTTYRWNEQSLQGISDMLLNSATMLRLTADCEVSHERAESSCNSIGSGLRAWRAEKWMPVVPDR